MKVNRIKSTTRFSNQLQTALATDGPIVVVDQQYVSDPTILLTRKNGFTSAVCFINQSPDYVRRKFLTE